MTFKIIKADLNWRGALPPLRLNRVDGIALHHMAHPTAGITEVHGWHLNNGWQGLGYGYWIGFDGTIYEGRGLNVNAGVSGRNGRLVSIGFQGNYDVLPGIKSNTEMPDAQYNAGVWLIEHLKAKVPSIKEVDGHNRWGKTACPGRYFPLAEMKGGKYRMREPQNQARQGAAEAENAVSAWAREAQRFVIDAGISDGTRPRDTVTREEIWVMLHRFSNRRIS